MIVFIAFEVFLRLTELTKSRWRGLKLTGALGGQLYTHLLPSINPTPCKKTHRVILHFALQNIDMMFLDFAFI
jgi:hypothetical protein